MKKYRLHFYLAYFLFFLILFLLAPDVFSQTGPAGVDNSVNNVLWLKANAGTSTTVNGQLMSGWNDQSGNANNALQPTAANQPVYNNSVINGYPAIHFDNTGGAVVDELVVADQPNLDNTNALTIFTVSRPESMTGTSSNAIISKRTNVNVNESYMLFYYTGNKFSVDVDGIGDRFAAPPVMTNGTNYLVDLVYDGSQVAASRSKLYMGGSLVTTSTETSASIPNYASNVTIGSLHTGDGRAFGGYIAEVIVFRKALNVAERTIIDNYLAAKYNLALATDRYAGDTPTNGDYDHEVAGIGTETSGSNLSAEASASGGLAISQASGFEAGDYLIYGHDSPVNTNTLTDIGGMTGALNSRWKRTWYFDITNAGTGQQVNLDFDMSDGGIVATTPGIAGNYVLLYRSALTDPWTEVTTASSVLGDRITFTGISLFKNGYYTLGTHDYSISPLPVEMLYFDAQPANAVVTTSWATASETNNDYFTVERSRDGNLYTPIGYVDGSGYSAQTHEYTFADHEPVSGMSYYRLKQTDYDGQENYSAIVPVNYNNNTVFSFVLYPNPAGSDEVFMQVDLPEASELKVILYDNIGNEIYSESTGESMAGSSTHGLNILKGKEPGIYFVSVLYKGKFYTEKLLVN